LAEAKFPAPERWREAVSGAVNNGLARMIKNRRFAEGRAFLAANASKLSADDYRRFLTMLADAELFHQVTAIRTIQDADTALAALDSAEALVPEERLNELRIFAVIKKAGFIAKERSVKEAIAYAESARADYGGDSQLDAQIRSLRDSRLAELHNAFAAAYNRRDFEQAGELIEAALEEFPENPRLLADRDLWAAARQ
jgi:tetratricopeptide (TPR) repeat protein